jgi:hypothetical protein
VKIIGVMVVNALICAAVYVAWPYYTKLPYEQIPGFVSGLIAAATASMLRISYPGERTE